MFLSQYIVAIAVTLAAPALQVEEPSILLRESLWSEPVTHAYELRNTGTEDLHVKVAKTSCGCTAAVLSNAAIPPGGTAKVELTYTPEPKKKQVGERSYSANLSTDDPAHPDLFLEMRFRLTDVVAAVPEALNFAAGAPSSQTLDIVCHHWNGPRKVLSAEATSPELSLRPLPAQEEDGKRTRYRYEVTYTPAESGRALRAGITLHTDSPEMPLLEVPVRTESVSCLIATPASLLFGAVHPGPVLTKSLTLTSKDPKAVPALAKAADPRIQVTLEPLPQPGQYRLTARLQPPPNQGAAEKLKTSIDILDRDNRVLGEISLFALLMPPE
jgi:hypothetical protein